MMTDAYLLHDIDVTIQKKNLLHIDKLAIPAESSIAILGDNGAGKSTLLRLLAFTLRPNKGEISLFNHPTTWPLSTHQRKRIAFVEQHPYLLNGTVFDNVKLALTLQHLPVSQHTVLIQQALKDTQSEHLEYQDVKTLSGGELKRVAIARAIAYQPDILLLDEPFSHLDNQHIEFLGNYIQTFSRQSGKTVIFSTHDRLQGMALSENTINLVAGKISTAPLVNIFNGYLNQQLFIADKLTIHTTSKLSEAHHIAIDPSQIIISEKPLQSSMQNSFSGRLILIAEQATTVHLTIDCGEQVHATISLEALDKLNLHLGTTVYLSFKSSTVTVF